MVNLEPLLSLLPYLILNHTVLSFLLNLNSLWCILLVCSRRILNIFVVFENASRPKKKNPAQVTLEEKNPLCVRSPWYESPRHKIILVCFILIAHISGVSKGRRRKMEIKSAVFPCETREPRQDDKVPHPTRWSSWWGFLISDADDDDDDMVSCYERERKKKTGIQV